MTQSSRRQWQSSIHLNLSKSTELLVFLKKQGHANDVFQRDAYFTTLCSYFMNSLVLILKAAFSMTHVTQLLVASFSWIQSSIQICFNRQNNKEEALIPSFSSTCSHIGFFFSSHSLYVESTSSDGFFFHLIRTAHGQCRCHHIDFARMIYKF